jgi:anionic cell wall polymer biosynthesis LytR-Cps2A-Psr (LCP) family protein
MKRKTKIILAVLVLLIAASIYGYKEFNRKKADTADLKTQFSIPSTELLKSFETDENKANVLYLDKIIEVSGKVSKIERTDSSISIMLNDGSSMASIMCQMDEPYKSVKIGELVTIKGICTGFLMDVILNRCVIKNQ